MNINKRWLFLMVCAMSLIVGTIKSSEEFQVKLEKDKKLEYQKKAFEGFLEYKKNHVLELKKLEKIYDDIQDECEEECLKQERAGYPFWEITACAFAARMQALSQNLADQGSALENEINEIKEKILNLNN